MLMSMSMLKKNTPSIGKEEHIAMIPTLDDL